MYFNKNSADLPKYPEGQIPQDMMYDAVIPRKRLGKRGYAVIKDLEVFGVILRMSDKLQAVY